MSIGIPGCLSPSPSSVVSARSIMPATEDLKKICSGYSNFLSSFQEDKKPFADFVWGQPREPPLPGMVAALRQSVEAGSDPDADVAYFGYCAYTGKYLDIVARSVQKYRGVTVDAKDCFVTNGALAGLVVSLTVTTDPGDEVLMVDPTYYLYKPMCQMLGINGVPVPCKKENFDLDIDAMEAAITPRSRAILINSPNNPTGRVYPAETLQKLGELLTRVNEGRDKPIMLISDEAYCRVVFDGVFAPSPIATYPYSVLVYTMGKQNLAPGERLGYMCLSPHMPEAAKVEMRDSVNRVINAMWARPSTVSGRAMEQLDDVLVDIPTLQRRRDRVVQGLREAGYSINVPQGTFYMMMECPRGLSGLDFVQELAKHRVLVAAGEAMGLPGSVRLSLTCSDEMVEFALPVFAKLR
eukprot:CAMPEP_0181292906 /NCGR_PEP_ID=MMETSP1101-20121128/2769_1 /TAXON_ID=46948 /ORGANISM="Rhodomonas abbreviata, Strain Caron Lab Isolate" /LENGTH=409 /DNA_ID=CAMNT_0023397433 /DNA_START=105 /DNA_END=1334 /DNA_ORIENTATION=-